MVFSIRRIQISCYVRHYQQVINLVGPASQQDVELSAFYNDAVNSYGVGNVLGILAIKSNDHELRKRAANDDNNEDNSPDATTQTPELTTLPEPDIATNLAEQDFIYYPDKPAKNSTRILLHTRSPPILFSGTKSTILSSNATITTNKRDDTYSLRVRYNTPGKVVHSKRDVIGQMFHTQIFFYSQASSTSLTSRAGTGR